MRFIFICAILIVFCISPSAFAYVDLGTGSYLLQIIIGFALAGLYSLKHYWARLRDWFTTKKKN